MPFLADEHVRTPKCFCTVSSLPAYLHYDQPPVKAQPFSSIFKQNVNHTLDLVIPETNVSALQEVLKDGSGTLSYFRVHMKLSEILQGNFFNEYIKSSNVLMLSEGRPGVDHIYSLREGILRLEVDKATYERLGITGTAVASRGRKHVKARFSIEINLRLPSMVRGRKGFDRMLWAAKEVLNRSVSWLVYDQKLQTNVAGPIAEYSPTLKRLEAVEKALPGVVVPTFPNALDEECVDDAADLLEWFSLTFVNSEKVQRSCLWDSYLSRYKVPGSDSGPDGARESDVQSLVRLRWHGFIPSELVVDVLLAALRASKEKWFAMSASSFDGHTTALLKHNDCTMTWSYED